VREREWRRKSERERVRERVCVYERERESGEERVKGRECVCEREKERE